MRTPLYNTIECNSQGTQHPQISIYIYEKIKTTSFYHQNSAVFLIERQLYNAFLRNCVFDMRKNKKIII